MTAKEILDIVRGAIRPFLAISFPVTVLVIGGLAAFKFLSVAVEFVDRDIANTIIVALLGFITGILTATSAIMFFMFGERAGKKKEEK